MTTEQPANIPIREFIGTRQAILFKTIKQPQFTGELILREPRGENWTFYTYLGRIVYGTGNKHKVRRWQRNLLTYVPSLTTNLPATISEAVKISNPEELSICWEYELLKTWVEQGDINRQQVGRLIRSLLIEVFFDLSQAKEITYEFRERKAFSQQLALVDSEQVIAAAWKQWQAWQAANFADYSPNLAPIIKNASELKKRTSEKTYQVLRQLLNGQYTLRELAIQTKRDVLNLTYSLASYWQLGLIALREIPDLPAPTLPIEPEEPPLAKPDTPQGPIIACIDDSIVICEEMKRIVTEFGYRFIGINDGLRSVSILLARKPDLIFLDLMMPNTNGYEICSQLRKLSSFRHTPIVILTGSDSIVDRVRAKMVGSSEFISKPISKYKVLEVINKYLHQASFT